MNLLSEISVAVFCDRFSPGIIFSISLLEFCYDKVLVTLNPQFSDLQNFDINLGFKKVEAVRSSGIPYSDFGETWKKYGLKFCENDLELFKFIDYDFVSSIDSYSVGLLTSLPSKNGQNLLDIGFLIKIFNPSFVEGTIEIEKNLNLALDFSRLVLERVRIYGIETVSRFRISV